jgi:uncharacterized protein (TIGR02271 family)
MMIKRNDIKEGMTVRSSDGEKLGKVFAVSDTEFHIEKGMFFPKDYLVRYAEVSDIRNGEIYLNHGREALRGLSDSGGLKAGTGALGATAAAATGAASGIGAGLKTGAQKVGDGLRTGAEKAGLKDRELRAQERTLDGEDIKLETFHEELEVQKRERRAGEAYITKRVVEEIKTVEVPLRHEEVVVERRAMREDCSNDRVDFQNERIRVPLKKEEAELTRHACKDGEVIIHKQPVEERRSMQGTVRHEEVDDVVMRTDEADLDDATLRTGYKAGADIDPRTKRS